LELKEKLAFGLQVHTLRFGNIMTGKKYSLNDDERVTRGDKPGVFSEVLLTPILVTDSLGRVHGRKSANNNNNRRSATLA
jgi:hypothetical protein